MKPAATTTSDNLRKDGRNVFATMAVFCGIASWVPLVIVMAFPLTFVCALLALITARMKAQRNGLGAAAIGIALAIAALALQLSVAALGGIFGVIGDLFSSAS